jgi:predicted XRE-type DNA-binding protein
LVPGSLLNQDWQPDSRAALLREREPKDGQGRYCNRANQAETGSRAHSWGEKQVKSENKPSHITQGDVFDDLGLSRSEASALKVKATLLDAILREIERQGYTQSQLVEILDEYQPSVSNLTRGKIAKVSVEKLLAYSDRLKMKTTLTVHSSSEKHRKRGFRVSRFQSFNEKAGVAKG